MIISKLDAARIQLDAAIDHFFNGNHVCALTLAGAAEDIFAGLLNDVGQQSAFQYLHDWYQKTYDVEVSKTDFSRQIANVGRNWVKHASEDPETKNVITERDSIMMLMRALPCYHRLTSTHTEKMEIFFQYVRENITEIDKWFS